MGANDINERFAKMWRSSREQAGKSQDYMAKALGVSKKTIQNWEAGYSCPSQIMGFKWFDALDLPALPYYLELLYADIENISADNSDADIDMALDKVSKGLSAEAKRKLFFLLYGDYGSTPYEVFDLMIAYCHIPLSARLAIAGNIITSYEICESYGLTMPHIKPNISRLKDEFTKHRKAVLDKKKTFQGGDFG